MLLLFLLYVLKPISPAIAPSATNLVLNGQFLSPKFEGDAFIYSDNEVFPWISKTMELVQANAYNSKVPKNVVAMELTPRDNVNVSQAISFDDIVQLQLKFIWFAKSGQVQNGRGRVLWNQKQVFQMTAKDESIQNTTLKLNSVKGNNVLTFEGRGAATSDNGLLVTNIILLKI